MGLIFSPDLQAGLSNIYRLLIEDGHFAAAVWAPPDQDTLIATRKYTDNNAGKVRFENEAFVISYT
jgi:hypothetical protein